MTCLYYDNQNFYKRMLDIQEKLRKSEEERIRLEEQFKILLQESQTRHDACINRLRMRYIEFLEEQRDREDRSNKLQGVLDKVDGHLTLMTAKSDRLNALRKHYEAYLLQVYGNQRSAGSVTGDSGVTSQHEDRSFRRDLISQSRRPSIQSVSIPPSTPITNFPSRVATPTLPKYSELRFVDSPRTHQSNFSYSHQQPLYSTPKLSYKQPQVLSSFIPHIPEIRISPSFSPSSITRDNVLADKPNHSSAKTFFDQSFTSVEPCQISGIGQISQVSTQMVPQFSNQFSKQVTHSPQIHDISQYLYTPSLPKTNGLLERSSSSAEFTGLSGLGNRPSIFTTTPPSYPDYSWKHASIPRFEEKSPRYEKYSFENNSIFGKNNEFEGTSKYEDRNPPRFFRRFDFNTTFRRNDRPLPSSKDILSSSRTKPSLKPFKLSSTLKSNYDVYGRSRRVDSELDRYIGKIRNLHRDVDLQSLEDLDHEQNTSGDLLNVTLSDDDLDLPVEEKIRVKALAKKEDQSEISGKQMETSKVTSATDPVTQTDTAVSKTWHDVPTNEEEKASAIDAMDEISSKNAQPETEIATDTNINSELAKSNENSVNKPLDEKEGVQEFGELISGNDDLPENKVEHQLEEEATTSDSLKKIEENKESGDKIEAEDLEIGTDEKSEPLKIEENEKKMEEGQVLEGENENQQGVEVVKENQDFQDQNQDYQYGSNQDYNYDPNAGYDQYQAYSAQGYEQYDQEYDPDQQYNQDPNQYSQDPNQQYDSNQQYQDPNQQYDPSQYSQDPNQYNQDPSQYTQDLNQYNQDPSQQIEQDGSQQFAQDSTQGYTEDPNQYDPSQQYQDPNIQYDPNQSYDPNQAYDYSQSQEYSQQDESYVQQNQSHSSDQPYDQNYIPEAVVGKDEKNLEKTQEKETESVESNNKKKDVVNLESDTESTIERNASNTESDFDFN